MVMRSTMCSKCGKAIQTPLPIGTAVTCSTCTQAQAPSRQTVCTECGTAISTKSPVGERVVCVPCASKLRQTTCARCKVPLFSKKPEGRSELCQACANARMEALPKKVGIAVLVGIVVIIAALSGGHTGGSTNNPASAASAASASYTAIFTNIDIVSSSQVDVSVLVQNDGAAAGTPGCTIIVGTPDYSGTGFQSLLAESPLSPGGSATYREHVTITNNNASKVTLGASSVTCS